MQVQILSKRICKHLKFPFARFASLWPFDGWNGPSDREAQSRESPNMTFPFLDGLLARLRKEIPDKEARFAAYAVVQEHSDPYAKAIQQLVEHSQELERSLRQLQARMAEMERDAEASQRDLRAVK